MEHMVVMVDLDPLTTEVGGQGGAVPSALFL